MKWHEREGSIIAVNKPKGIKSTRIVAMVRRLTGGMKVGHGGTLDPLAAGVIIIGIGRAATKLLWAAEHQKKEYIADLRFGESSATDDEEGEKTVWPAPPTIPTYEELNSTLQKFVGAIQQIPPQYSAVKREGQAAYKSARSGKTLELPARTVNIHEIKLLNYEWPRARIAVSCGSGTYVRSLVRDVGAQLACGAYMSDLLRTQVGRFTLEESMLFEDLV